MRRIVGLTLLLGLVAGSELCAYQGSGHGVDEQASSVASKLWRSEMRSLPDKVAEQCELLTSSYFVGKIGQLADDKKTPLVLYLHGAGGRGEKFQRALPAVERFMDELARWCGEQESLGCVVLAPQCRTGEGPAGGIWQLDDLNLWLDTALSDLNVDQRRIYLTGYSMGGYGTWMWAASDPGRFAAAAPIAGGLGQGGPKDITPEFDAWAKSLTQVPLWAFHGKEDRVVPSDRSTSMVEAIRKAGGESVRITLYDHIGHGAAGPAFKTDALYEWMFEQRRDGS